MKQRTVSLILLSVFLCLLISGCGFHLRSKREFPAELTQFYFSGDSLNTPLAIQLRQLFRSLDIRLVKNPALARYSVLLTRDHFTYARPDIVDASLPTGISYLQSSTVTIVDNRTRKNIATNDFVTSQTQTLNANQVFTASANNLVQTQLCREMMTLIYYWLISSNTKDAIRHAITAKTT